MKCNERRSADQGIYDVCPDGCTLNSRTDKKYGQRHAVNAPNNFPHSRAQRGVLPRARLPARFLLGLVSLLRDRRAEMQE